MCAESYRFIVINNLLLVEQQLCLVMDAMAEAFSQIKTVCTLSLSFIKTKTETVKKHSIILVKTQDFIPTFYLNDY